jgi:NAD(P)-dependent dehydrogenase (short-subunit alcohol dehydrogenase family)
MQAVAHGSLAAAHLYSLAGRVALITGGGRGIGEMIARAFVENGARVYIASRSADTLSRTASRLSAAGPGSCHALEADVGTAAGCVSLAAALRAHEPALNVLVNNSGVAWGAPLADFPEAELDRAWALNVRAPLLLSRALLPLLRAGATAESAPGAADAAPSRIINVGSIVALRAQPVPTWAYEPTKAALHALSTKLAAELAPAVTVNTLAPGYVPTRMSRPLLAVVKEDALKAAVPMGRFGSAADIGGAALFLASRAGAWVTGTTLVVDGGMLAQNMKFVDGDA